MAGLSSIRAQHTAGGLESEPGEVPTALGEIGLHGLDDLPLKELHHHAVSALCVPVFCTLCTAVMNLEAERTKFND